MAKSAIKLRARCANILFVFIIISLREKPFARAVEIHLAQWRRLSLDNFSNGRATAIPI
jgi:hypothetical protein